MPSTDDKMHATIKPRVSPLIHCVKTVENAHSIFYRIAPNAVATNLQNLQYSVGTIGISSF